MYCRQEHKPGWCQVYGKRCDGCGKINHFKVECRGSQISAVNAAEKEDIHVQESDIEMVNINSFSLNSNHSMILANLKRSSKQATIMVPCKVDTGCDGSIIPCNIFKNYSLTPQKIKWWQ